LYDEPHLHQWELMTSYPMGDWDDDPAYPWYRIPMGTPKPVALMVSHWFLVTLTLALAAIPCYLRFCSELL